MIMIGLGANLPSPAGKPVETCEAALHELDQRGISISNRSPWYQSAPVPASDQPWFVNGLVSVDTQLAPQDLLSQLLEIELLFGRQRSEANAARSLDLDIIAYNDEQISIPGLEIPHPRIAERAFVLLPLRSVAPDWTHPVTGIGVEEMITALGVVKDVVPLN